MKFEFSAGGIVYQKLGEDFKFVLILDSYQKWTFPKGKIEKKEKPAEAALREVGEEIGLENLKIIDLIEKIDYWFKNTEGLIHKFVYFYLMKAPRGTKLKPQTEEIQDARWFSLKETEESLDYRKENIKLLRKSLEILKNSKK